MQTSAIWGLWKIVAGKLGKIRIQSSAKPVLNLHSGFYLGHYGCDYIYIFWALFYSLGKNISSGQLMCLDYVTGFASVSASENSNFSSFF